MMMRLSPNPRTPSPISAAVARNQSPVYRRSARQLSQVDAISPPPPQKSIMSPQPETSRRRMSSSQTGTRMPITLMPRAVSAQLENTTQRTTGS